MGIFPVSEEGPLMPPIVKKMHGQLVKKGGGSYWKGKMATTGYSSAKVSTKKATIGYDVQREIIL